MFLPDSSEPEVTIKKDSQPEVEGASKFVDANPFDPNRGVVDQTPTLIENSEEIIKQVVEPEHPHNFTLRGLMTIKQEQAVILHYRSAAGSQPKAPISGRKPSSGSQVNDQVFKLEDDVGETGYSVAEISSEEVILVNKSGQEIVLMLDESSSISSGMREAAQSHVEKENKIIAEQQRAKEIKVPPKVSDNVKSDDKKPESDREKSREEKWRDMRMERIKKLKEFQKLRQKQNDEQL